jgi:exosortase
MALLIHVGSVWTHIFFTSGFSILLLCVGSCLYFFGLKITRKIAFPLLFLLFMFPLPMGAVAVFSFPLKLGVANLAAICLGAFGLPLFREGAVVHLARTTLTIDDPCSGIRSLISLLALGALIAYFSKIKALKKGILFIAAIPIAIFTNVLRVCALILAANWLGAQWAMPEHWFHTASGMGVFAVSLILLFFSMKMLERKR